LLTNEEGNNGWVVKTPFTTNCEHLRFPKTLDAVIDAIISLNNCCNNTIPYIMIQACMENRKEYKVVLFNESVQFLAVNTRQSKPSKSFSRKPHNSLFEFAHQAVKDLKRSCPEFLCDGLVRVDIFQDKYGDFIVNEFESLEANYYTFNIDDMKLTEKLTDYWMEKIFQFVEIINLHSNTI
jgi:hypothetical protein